jgi:hypothetical protein
MLLQTNSMSTTRRLGSLMPTFSRCVRVHFNWAFFSANNLVCSATPRMQNGSLQKTLGQEITARCHGAGSESSTS